MGRALGTGLAGGLLAGATVGAIEAVVSWFGGHGMGEMPAIAWGLVVYGALGGLAGIGAGVVAGVLGTDGFGVALGGVLGTLGFVVARFRVIRDVFLEQAPKGLVPTLVQVAVLAAVVLVAIGIWRVFRGADARRGLLTQPLPVIVLLAVLAGVAHLALRTTEPAPTPVAADRHAAAAGAPNIILIMCDTLRADHLSSYGYSANKTPRIDGLAAEGIRFAHTFAQASWTRPSVATILTGLYPSSHNAVHKADLLPDSVLTIAEMLSAGGYYTAGLANNANVAPNFNFGQGFDDYRYLAPDLFFYADEPAAQLTFYNGLRLVRERFLARRVDVHNYYQPAETITAEATRWLDGPAARGGRPFFLFLHYMDAHDPYMAHPFNGEGVARVAMPNPAADQADRLRGLYDGGISYMDEHLGALFDDLKKRGQWDNTVVLLTADHGEEFHEHGGWWHGTTLYDEQTHVPLIVKPAHGGARGRVVEDLTTSLDIVPTLLTAGGVKVPESLPGHVLPLGDAAVTGWEQVFSESDLEGNVLKAIRSKDWKYIEANADNPRGLQPEELYDLAKDPGEKQNVGGSQPRQKEVMRAGLGRASIEARKQAKDKVEGKIDYATCQRLCALGYVSCDTCVKH